MTDRDAIQEPGLLDFLLGLPGAIVDVFFHPWPRGFALVPQAAKTSRIPYRPAAQRKSTWSSLQSDLELKHILASFGWRFVETYYDASSCQFCVKAMLDCGHAQTYKICDKAVRLCDAGTASIWILLDQAIDREGKHCGCGDSDHQTKVTK